MSTPVTLALLPALDGTGVFLEPLRHHLPSWVAPRVMTYPESGPHDYESLCDLLATGLRGPDPLHLLGWSFGGPLALMLAERLGGRVRSVTLCATFVTPPIPFLVPLRWGLRGPVVGVARGLWRTRFLAPGIGSKDFRAAKAVTWEKVSSTALAARGRAIMGVDVRATLNRLPVPVLYLAGTRDRVVGPRSAAEVMAWRPDAQLAHLPGGHFALFNEAPMAAARIAGFLAGAADPGKTSPRRQGDLAQD